VNQRKEDKSAKRKINIQSGFNDEKKKMEKEERVRHWHSTNPRIGRNNTARAKEK